MKNFLRDTLIFGLILSLLLLLIKRTVPFYWGNDLLGAKISHVMADETLYDSFFVGSSKSYRHLNPKIYDATTGRSAFNLGSWGMFALETHYILDKFAQKYPNADDTHYYLQKLAPNAIADKNLHTLRSKYYMDFKRLRMGASYFAKQKDYEQVYNHTVSYLENLLCIGEVLPILSYHFTEREPVNDRVISQKGYFPLDQELKFNKDWRLKKRNKEYLASVKKKKSRLRKQSDIRIKTLSSEELRISDQNGKITFYQIAGNPVVDNELYFDKGHLNAKGANAYTRKVAEYVKNKMK